MTRTILWLAAALAPLLAEAQDFKAFDAALERADFAAAEALLLPALKAKGAKDPARAGLHRRLGDLYVQWWRWAEAERELHAGLQLAGAPPAEREAMLEELALLLERQGRRWEALQVLKELVAQREENHGKLHPSVGGALARIGALNREEPFRFSELKQAFVRADSILSPLLHGKPIPTAHYERLIYFAINGTTYVQDPYAPRRWPDHCDLRRAQIAQIEKEKGPASRSLIEPLAEYASCDLRSAEQESVLQRARGLAVRDFGEIHPDVLFVDDRLENYYASREYDEERNRRRAREIKQRMARTSEQLYGKDGLKRLDDRLADRLEYIRQRDCRFSAGDCQRELDALIAAYERNLRPRHAFTAMTMRLIVFWLSETSPGDSEGNRNAHLQYAEALHKRTLELFEQIYTRDHPEWALQNQRYATFLANWREDKDRARDLLTSSLAVYRKYFGSNDEATIDLAGERMRMIGFRRKEESLKALQETIDAFDEKNPWGDRRRLAELLESLAELQVFYGLSLPDAERHYLRSLDLRRRYGAVSNEAQVAKKLAALYRKQNDRGKAESMEALAACLSRSNDGRRPQCG